MAIVKRLVKGSALTFAELDNNFDELANKRADQIAFSAAIPFTLASAKSSVIVNQNYALSLGANAVADSYQTIITTGNGTNVVSFPTAWKNINGGVFDPNKIQKIRLSYDGAYVEYTIVDLSVIADVVGPTVVIASTVSGTSSVTPIPYTITLNEPSTNFTIADLTAGNQTLQNFAGSGTDYTVEGVPSANGNVTLQVLAGVLTDAAGNPNTASNQLSINHQAGYPAWTNTQSMVIDAAGEGIEVTDNNLYPSDGAGNDEAIFFEIWFKTPPTLKSSRLLTLSDDTLDILRVATDVIGKIYLQLFTTAGVNYVNISDSSAVNPAPDTWYTYFLCYTGIKTAPAGTLKIDNVARTLSVVETGEYTGFPARNGNLKLKIPYAISSLQGHGNYNLLRIYNRQLTGPEETLIYNGRTPMSLAGHPDLLNSCVYEQRFEGNAISAVGEDGVFIGTPGFIAELPS